ncbi:MAG TPA: hypothetical protein VIW24_12125 [Aldersonia sp.]
MTADNRAGIVHSEFAQIRVDIDHEGLSPRLRLEDLRTGRVRFLDALELETIVWLHDDHLASLLDPSSDRWREDPDAESEK